MNLQRFFISPNSIDRAAKRILVSDEKLSKQISKVLRLRAGARIDFLDGTGNLYQAELGEADRNVVSAKLLTVIEPDGKAKKKPLISAVFPPLRHGRFEWALEKLTELDVDQICPVILERSVSRPGEEKGGGKKHHKGGGENDHALDGGNKIGRWQSIVKEAAEQCERLVLPHLVPVRSFRDHLAGQGEKTQNEVRLICAERRDVPFLSVVLCNHLAKFPASSITIAVGAEGGFTNEEMEQAISAGYAPVSLGANILRAETAIVYALAIVASVLEMPPEAPQSF